MIEMFYSLNLFLERKDLSLSNVVLLDRVQKNLSITKGAAVALRKEGLIEGRIH